jgi:hypothetical protein
MRDFEEARDDAAVVARRTGVRRFTPGRPRRWAALLSRSGPADSRARERGWNRATPPTGSPLAAGGKRAIVTNIAVPSGVPDDAAPFHPLPPSAAAESLRRLADL